MQCPVRLCPLEVGVAINHVAIAQLHSTWYLIPITQYESRCAWTLDAWCIPACCQLQILKSVTSVITVSMNKAWCFWQKLSEFNPIASYCLVTRQSKHQRNADACCRTIRQLKNAPMNIEVPRCSGRTTTCRIDQFSCPNDTNLTITMVGYTYEASHTQGQNGKTYYF